MKDALKDEGGATKFYANMKKAAPREIQGLIDRIQHDEKTHKLMLKRFQRDYCL